MWVQIARQLTGVRSVVFELKPLPTAGYTDLVTGPTPPVTTAGGRLLVEPALVDRLLANTAESADASPRLALC